MAQWWKWLAFTSCFAAAALSPDLSTAQGNKRIPTAEGERQCSELIKECFASSSGERSNCLFSFAKHPFCEGTDLGKLAMKRWSMSPATENQSAESAEAFLGPKLVDSACVENFDMQWFGTLERGEFTRSAAQQLERDLVKCNREPPGDLLRP